MLLSEPAVRPTTGRGPVVLFALLVLACLGRLAFTIWEGPFDGSISVADAARPGLWPMNLYLGAPSYIVSFVAVAVFLVVLGRASVLSVVAGALVGLGGIVFGLVINAEVLPFVYAVDPAVLPAADGAELVAALDDRLDLLLPTILGSSAVIALGAVLGLVATALARTAPRWFAPAALAGVVVAQLLPQVGLVAVGYVLDLAVIVGIGWFGMRVART
ncbi:hypothetical protein SAMN03159343_3448 [Klenkia marina]|uniref:DUF4386 family protein n=1 Tax=Klenkia marina TaxID=1960309 RepID=A0A1G4YT96_9ACTN|nr:hypothetical protein [Klenkia marina]SCX56565.1 hypothetical protein SAMN03159343_3448 [Klenkia marina]